MIFVYISNISFLCRLNKKIVYLAAERKTEFGSTTRSFEQISRCHRGEKR